jgi:hypothetical protein
MQRKYEVNCDGKESAFPLSFFFLEFYLTLSLCLEF